MAMQTHEAAELRSYRLPNTIVEAIEDVARGVDEGEAGLKSCALGALAAGNAGANATEVNARHHHEVAIVEDEDECFNRIGEYLANGFSFAEVARIVTLGGGATHLLALERWCQLIGLECDADEELPTEHTGRRWRASARHERRRRVRRAFQLLRATPAGTTHAAVLHVVYGWPDPFVRTLTPEARSAFGREFGPLARYTDVVEAKRQELVRAEAARRQAAHVPTTARHAPGSLAAALAWTAKNAEANRLAAKHGVDLNSGVFDLERRRSLLAWADRAISSGDALRASTDRLQTPDKDARDAFITQVRIEANRMLSEASVAFLDAWHRS